MLASNVFNKLSAKIIISTISDVNAQLNSKFLVKITLIFYRLVVFSDAAVEHVEVSIDGEEKQVAHKSASNLYVVPWQPSRYSMGLHHMTVTAKVGGLHLYLFQTSTRHGFF